MSSNYNDFNRNLIADLRANGGKATSGPFLGRDVLIVTSKGAKTGEARETPLAYTRAGDGYVIIASKGGAPSHPGWYHNLKSNPDVTVEVLGETLTAVAEEQHGAERDRLYAAQAAKMPAFAEYETKTTRKIPLFILKPKG